MTKEKAASGNSTDRNIADGNSTGRNSTDGNSTGRNMTSGSVVLVGAGPGGAGLLTLRGKEAIENAEVVLFDRLVGPEILSFVPDTAQKVDVGKRAGHHPVPQAEINGLLLRFAKEGKRVVRLKGGDPYLFGRGAEELEAVLDAHIPFEVVPGVTSAVAVPAFAGIPVSHRDFSSSVHIITAHRKNNGDPEIDYAGLTRLGGTLIFLMGLEAIGAVSSGLIEAGMPASTPAALIENGTRPNQRRLVSALDEIAFRAKRELFRSPSVFVVGGVCALAEKLDWFSRLPLRGAGIVVTRPKAESGLAHKLRALGASVTEFPCIRTSPLPVPERIFTAPAQYDWIVFTSPVGARLYFDGLKARGLDIRSLAGLRFAAVGAKTAAAVKDRGIAVDYVPDTYHAGALAAGLPPGPPASSAAHPGAGPAASPPACARSAPAAAPPTDAAASLPADTGDLPADAGLSRRVLLFRAQEGAPELARALARRGFSVEDLAAYQTMLERGCPPEIREVFDRGEAAFVTFTSASTVQGFRAALPVLDCSALTAICIGAQTAAEAGKHGFRVRISEQATIESMIACIQKEVHQ